MAEHVLLTDLGYVATDEGMNLAQGPDTRGDQGLGRQPLPRVEPSRTEG